MPALYNKYDKETLLKMLAQEPHHRITISFYKYANIGNPAIFRDHLYQMLSELKVLGRIYVSTEGVNAQINIPEENMYTLRQKLDEIVFLEGCRLNVAIEQNDLSFLKLKIKVRHKIVADGLDDSTFDVTKRGKHLDAEEFNQLAEKDNTIIVDMRNHYESEVGHFKNAWCPDVDTFREELDFVEETLKGNEGKNVLMYCTGGIRCEKASAYFKHKGFENVYQLNGGIIEYTRQVRTKKLENRFIGKNFVFDERLGERISDDIIATCHQCGKPCDDHTNCKNVACNLLFIQCEDCKTKNQNCCSDECKEINALPVDVQREMRKGKFVARKVFKKGRSEKLKFKPNNTKPSIDA